MDRGGIEQRTLSLVIKTPSQAHGDQTVDGVDPGWTVGDLKAHLSSVYPDRPAVSDQRLIFAGKLLPNHLHLQDLFKQTDATPTLHLVCSVRSPFDNVLGARPKVKEAQQLHPHPTSSSRPPPMTESTVGSPGPASASSSTGASSSSRAQAAGVPAADSVPPELRRRLQTSTASDSAPVHGATPAPATGSRMHGTADMAQPTFPTYSLYSPQQLLWLQHIYARQYYMQYHAALAAAGTTSLAPAATPAPHPPVPAHQAPVPAHLPNPNPIDNLPANQNPAPDAPFINPGAANQNMQMNAQGGAVMEDEEEMERDWLDWMYSAARLGVLLMIVYFNSSLSRFVLVMSALVLMYLHTAGWFPFRRRAPNAQPQQQQPPQQQPPQQPLQQQQQPLEALHNQQNQAVEEPAHVEGEEPVNAGEEPEEQGPMAAVLVPPYRVSAAWTAWVLVKSFFSSLIPEAPRGIAN
ncbi:Homocysteine-responsive endoplasmic reticulum-resident ubiquitin-like domain member 1 protein [Merluccius polli]|uniref:Homocysteine-responsive endoplasmic reticulum-resident ubiquitin-like domain member 1 protein n=1 Tax=Merluccius polli TaxID=89951 RepID=A0AA47MKN5_MERPO|nr:Homocysteine-responsive endoplasmic reticulum-resident ubiquitin-like domain member 1 protein [Merluccius polli]